MSLELLLKCAVLRIKLFDHCMVNTSGKKKKRDKKEKHPRSTVKYSYRSVMLFVRFVANGLDIWLPLPGG